MTTQQQMEMRLDTPVRNAWRIRSERRRTRARWWFREMHRRVENAIDRSNHHSPHRQAA